MTWWQWLLSAVAVAAVILHVLFWPKIKVYLGCDE